MPSPDHFSDPSSPWLLSSSFAPCRCLPTLCARARFVCRVASFQPHCRCIPPPVSLCDSPTRDIAPAHAPTRSLTPRDPRHSSDSVAKHMLTSVQSRRLRHLPGIASASCLYAEYVPPFSFTSLQSDPPSASLHMCQGKGTCPIQTLTTMPPSRLANSTSPTTTSVLFSLFSLCCLELFAPCWSQPCLLDATCAALRCKATLPSLTRISAGSAKSFLFQSFRGTASN